MATEAEWPDCDCNAADTAIEGEVKQNNEEWEEARNSDEDNNSKVEDNVEEEDNDEEQDDKDEVEAQDSAAVHSKDE